MIEELSYEMDEGLGPRASIGLIALATDHTIEYEFRKILDLLGVVFYVTRVENEVTINLETLQAMEAKLTHCADIILPGMDHSVFAFGCTSASTVIGEEKVISKIQENHPGVPVTTPITAVVAALKKLALKRIAVITPYRDDVNVQLRGLLVSRGFEIPYFGSFKQEDDNFAARISPTSINDAILDIGARDDVDSVFLSCTNLRLADDVKALEDKLQKPVISSNLAMAWHCLRLSGIDDKLPQYGRLYVS